MKDELFTALDSLHSIVDQFGDDEDRSAINVVGKMLYNKLPLINFIARIDEGFASSPIDGCYVISIDEWKIIKSVIQKGKT